MSSTKQNESPFWRQINAVLSLYYTQWKFWAIVCICLLFVWVNLSSNPRHDETNIRYETNDDLKFHLRVIRKPLTSKIVVNPSMYSEPEWEEFWEKLCDSEKRETIYLAPNWPEGSKKLTHPALLELLRFRAELQSTGEYQGEIKLAITLDEGSQFFQGRLFLIVILMLWGVSLSALESPRVRLTPALIWPHLLVPTLMSLVCFTYVLVSFYKPYFNVGAYLTLSLLPFSFCSLVLIYKEVRRRPKTSLTKMKIISWYWYCMILSMFLDWNPTFFYQEFLFGQHHTLSWITGIVSIVLLLSIVPLLNQRLVYVVEDDPETQREGFFGSGSGANWGADKNLLAFIQRFHATPTKLNRDRLLYMSEYGNFSFLSLLGYIIGIFLVVFVMSIANKWFQEEPINLQRLLFFPLMFASVWLCDCGIRGVVPTIVTKAGFATIPMTKRESRNAVFGGIVRRYLPWFVLLSAIIGGWSWWGPVIRIQSMTFILSALFAVLAVMLTTVAVGLWIGISRGHLEFHQGVIFIVAVVLGVIIPIEIIDSYHWNKWDSQVYIMFGMELFIPSVISIWYAWNKWLDVEWGYIPESKSFID